MEPGLCLPQSVSQVSYLSHEQVCLCTPVSSGPLSALSFLPGRSYTVLLSIIFGGLAIVALISIVYMMLHRHRKSST